MDASFKLSSPSSFWSRAVFTLFVVLFRKSAARFLFSAANTPNSIFLFSIQTPFQSFFTKKAVKFARRLSAFLKMYVFVSIINKKTQIARSLKHKSGNAQACAAGLIPARTQGEPCRAANAGAHSVNACMPRIRDTF